MNVRELHFDSNYREIVAKSFTGKLSALSITFFEKFVLSHFFDCSFLLTKQDLKDNYSRYKLFTGKMAVQHNPCSFENECPDDCQRQKKILCVGRICPQKNFEAMLEIWSRIADKLPQWKLRIVGGTPTEVSYLKSVCEKFNVNSSVELPGWSSDIPSEMQHASILCCTSRYEGFPLVLIEAMHYGLPIVSWNLPYGPAEIIEDGVTGFLTPFGNKDAMAGKLLELLSNPNLIEQMRPHAIKRSKRFAPKSIAMEWMKHFES